jgi:hypothetical protein
MPEGWRGLIVAQNSRTALKSRLHGMPVFQMILKTEWSECEMMVRH